MEDWDLPLGMEREHWGEHQEAMGSKTQCPMTWSIAGNRTFLLMHQNVPFGEMGKKTNGMADIELAHDMGRNEFHKSVSAGETFLRNNVFCFSHILGSFEGHQVIGHR